MDRASSSAFTLCAFAGLFGEAAGDPLATEPDPGVAKSCRDLAGGVLG